MPHDLHHLIIDMWYHEFSADHVCRMICFGIWKSYLEIRALSLCVFSRHLGIWGCPKTGGATTRATHIIS